MVVKSLVPTVNDDLMMDGQGIYNFITARGLWFESWL